MTPSKTIIAIDAKKIESYQALFLRKMFGMTSMFYLDRVRFIILYEVDFGS